MNDQPTAEHTLVGDEQALEQLRALRGSIDNLDAALVHLLAERFKCTQQVGELKAAHQLRRPTRPARPTRSPGCGGWRRRRSSIRRSRRSS